MEPKKRSRKFSKEGVKNYLLARMEGYAKEARWLSENYNEMGAVERRAWATEDATAMYHLGLATRQELSALLQKINNTANGAD